MTLRGEGVPPGVLWGKTYKGTTDGSGLFSVVFETPYAVPPSVNPQTEPNANSVTRVRVTAVSTTGFTVRTETNTGINVLGIDVLGLSVAAVPNVPVAVIVTPVT